MILVFASTLRCQPILWKLPPAVACIYDESESVLQLSQIRWKNGKEQKTDYSEASIIFRWLSLRFARVSGNAFLIREFESVMLLDGHCTCYVESTPRQTSLTDLYRLTASK